MEQRLHRSNRTLRGSGRHNACLRAHRNRGCHLLGNSTRPIAAQTQRMARHVRNHFRNRSLSPHRLRLLLTAEANRSLSRRKRRQACRRTSHHFLQQTFHRARASPRQALSLEGRRRHHHRRHADLSSRQIRSEASAHVHLHPRRTRRSRRRLLRSRLVQVGSASRHQRLASIRAQLPRVVWIRRQVPRADRSRNRLPSRQRYSRRRRRSGKRRHRRSRSSQPSAATATADT